MDGLLLYCTGSSAILARCNLQGQIYNMKHKEHKLYHLVIVAQLEFQIHLRCLRLDFVWGRPVTVVLSFGSSNIAFSALQTFAGFVLTVSGPLIATLDNDLLWLRTSINSSRITFEVWTIWINLYNCQVTDCRKQLDILILRIKQIIFISLTTDLMR